MEAAGSRGRLSRVVMKLLDTGFRQDSHARKRKEKDGVGADSSDEPDRRSTSRVARTEVSLALQGKTSSRLRRRHSSTLL